MCPIRSATQHRLNHQCEYLAATHRLWHGTLQAYKRGTFASNRDPQRRASFSQLAMPPRDARQAPSVPYGLLWCPQHEVRVRVFCELCTDTLFKK